MNRKTSKRILGMTGMQLVILALLGLTACCLLGGGFWFFSASLSGKSFSFRPEPTAQPSTTPTPRPTETATLTPTATPVPYLDLIPAGWNQYTNGEIEIWLPAEFTDIGVEQGMKELIQGYKEIGQGDLAEEFENSGLDYQMWFKASSASSQIFYTSIVISSLPMAWTSLDEFIDDDLAAYSGKYRVNDRRQVQIGELDARRVTLESNIGTQYIGYIYYAIDDGENIWLIDFSAHLNDFYTWAPTFDRIARTFRLLK